MTVAGCGAKLGRADVGMLPGEVGTDINYCPVGDWSPTVNFNKVMAVYSVEDNESNHLEYQLVVRTANDVRSPNLWQTVEAAWANPTVPNSERNSTALSLPAGANVPENNLGDGRYFPANGHSLELSRCVEAPGADLAPVENCSEKGGFFHFWDL